MRFVEVDLLVGDLDHLVLCHARGEDGTERLVIEEGEGATRGVPSARCSSSTGLDALDVFKIVVSDGGAPRAGGGEVCGDLGIGFEAVGFVARNGKPR